MEDRQFKLSILDSLSSILGRAQYPKSSISSSSMPK